MPPGPSDSDAQSHQALLDSLDVAPAARPFRNPHWKPSQRRNKNVKQIIGEAARREVSTLATQNNSGTTTPVPPPPPPPPPQQQHALGSATPSAAAGDGRNTNIAQAAQSLGSLVVLEKNLQTGGAAGADGRLMPGSATLITAAGGGGGAAAAAAGSGVAASATAGGGPVATYTNIESAPSLHPAHQKPYCDITGLPAPYRDPKTRLRYHNREVFAMIRTLPQGVAEQYLAARGAHVVLK